MGLSHEVLRQLWTLTIKTMPLGSGRLVVVVAAAASLVAAVTLAVVVVSLRTILCVHIGGFSYFLKRRSLAVLDLVFVAVVFMP